MILGPSSNHERPEKESQDDIRQKREERYRLLLDKLSEQKRSSQQLQGVGNAGQNQEQGGFVGGGFRLDRSRFYFDDPLRQKSAPGIVRGASFSAENFGLPSVGKPDVNVPQVPHPPPGPIKAEGRRRRHATLRSPDNAHGVHPPRRVSNMSAPATHTPAYSNLSQGHAAKQAKLQDQLAASLHLSYRLPGRNGSQEQESNTSRWSRRIQDNRAAHKSSTEAKVPAVNNFKSVSGSSRVGGRGAQSTSSPANASSSASKPELQSTHVAITPEEMGADKVYLPGLGLRFLEHHEADLQKEKELHRLKMRAIRLAAHNEQVTYMYNKARHHARLASQHLSPLSFYLSPHSSDPLPETPLDALDHHQSLSPSTTSPNLQPLDFLRPPDSSATPSDSESPLKAPAASQLAGPSSRSVRIGEHTQPIPIVVTNRPTSQSPPPIRPANPSEAPIARTLALSQSQRGSPAVSPRSANQNPPRITIENPDFASGRPP